MSKLKYSAGNFAATHDENPPSWRNISSKRKYVFGISAEKPGTEVADYRDSTLYSGVEYSWASTENMYGEDAFICQ